jgi:hypothetical protein
MKASTVHEIKEELNTLQPARLTELCLRLARFKKENKELLTYLLFESHDETSYVNAIKAEVDEAWQEINLKHLYFVKKTLRKILRMIRKHIRYMGSKQAEVELLLYFCTKLSESDIPIHRNKVIGNIYDNEKKKVLKVIETLHEDLQYDYLKEYNLLK